MGVSCHSVALPLQSEKWISFSRDCLFTSRYRRKQGGRLQSLDGQGSFTSGQGGKRLTEEQIAQKLGVSLAIVKRYFNAHDAYLPSLEMSRRLGKVLGNDILVRWLNADIPPAYGKELHRKEMLSGMARATIAFDALRQLVGEESVSPSVREIQEGMDRLIEELGRIEEALYGGTFLPLEKRKILPCPWWKFWRRRR